MQAGKGITVQCINSTKLKQQQQSKMTISTGNIYLFKFNNRQTRERSETYSKLTIETPEQRQPFCRVSIVDFEQANVSRDIDWNCSRNNGTMWEE